MASPKPTLNQADITLLKGIFATKDDLKIELKPIKRKVSKIEKDINMIIGDFDNRLINHRKHIENIEDRLNLPSPSSII